MIQLWVVHNSVQQYVFSRSCPGQSKLLLSINGSVLIISYWLFPRLPCTCLAWSCTIWCHTYCPALPLSCVTLFPPELDLPWHSHSPEPTGPCLSCIDPFPSLARPAMNLTCFMCMACLHFTTSCSTLPYLWLSSVHALHDSGPVLFTSFPDLVPVQPSHGLVVFAFCHS